MELAHRARGRSAGARSRSASALCYSPSTISAQLSQLEREVGVPLLVPVGRRVRLTPEAETLVGHVEAVLERLEHAEADLARARTVLDGDLRIATFQTAAKTLVLPALARLHHDHPTLRVHVSQQEPQRALPALLAHDYDLVLAEEYPATPIPSSPAFAPNCSPETLLDWPPRPAPRHRRSTISPIERG